MTWPPRRVLVGTDFSETSRAAARAAAGLARRTHAELELAHAIRRGPELVTGYEPLDALLLRTPDPARARAHIEAELASLAAELAPQAVRPHVVEGPPAAEILALRERLDVDLVALGAVGLRGLRRFVLGSVADRVLRRPGCPLLLVRRRSQPASSRRSWSRRSTRTAPRRGWSSRCGSRTPNARS
ncbi:MAG: universal stress protein [Deltaproteobacteria bacterium]|nr:universal stress protein [Deltaproteobacteria bacterium]